MLPTLEELAKKGKRREARPLIMIGGEVEFRASRATS
jgi:hypothetical protein